VIDLDTLDIRCLDVSHNPTEARIIAEVSLHEDEIRIL
jgi:hypothetical protein